MSNVKEIERAELAGGDVKLRVKNTGNVHFAINTVNHMFGSRRFDTIDESRNNVVTAFFAVGEGWHNNHHRYQRAARNGFYWWEFDPTWYVIRAMQAVGLAWNVQVVPARIYDEARTTKARRRAVQRAPTEGDRVAVPVE